MRLGGNASLFLLLKLWMQLQELPVVLPDAAQRAARPNEPQGIALLLGEMPVDIGGGMKTIRQRIQQQGRRNTDVITLREAIHRDAHVHVGMLDGIIGKAQLLRAKDQSDGLVQRERFGCEIVAVGTGGHNLVTLLVQLPIGLGCVKLTFFIIIHIEPFRAAQYHVGIDIIMIGVFHDVDVLDATEVTGTQYRAGIMGLEDILQNDRYMPCAEVEHFLETLPALVGDERRQKLKHGRITSGIPLYLNAPHLSSVVNYGFLHGFKSFGLRDNGTRDYGTKTMSRVS